MALRQTASVSKAETLKVTRVRQLRTLIANNEKSLFELRPMLNDKRAYRGSIRVTPTLALVGSEN